MIFCSGSDDSMPNIGRARKRAGPRHGLARLPVPAGFRGAVQHGPALERDVAGGVRSARHAI